MNTLIGTHCIVEMHDCPTELLNDVGHIEAALTEAAARAQSTLLERITHQFHPQGVTALALLAESHISVHTWPEDGYAAADLFTCGTHTVPEAGCRALVEAFRPGRHVTARMSRGSLQPRLEIIERHDAELTGNRPDGETESEDAPPCREPKFAQISG